MCKNEKPRTHGKLGPSNNAGEAEAGGFQDLLTGQHRPIVSFGFSERPYLKN